MTGDIGPMEECPVTKSGRHNLCVVTPGDDEGDLTIFCGICGAIRRVPAKGAIGVPLDDLSADEIVRAMKEGTAWQR